ncbi:MAG: alpha/beta hydrolase [Myxococcota bacterium]
MGRIHVPDPAVTLVELLEVELACLTWGPSDGPLVVLVHGFPETPHTWRAIAPRLAAEGFWVVAPYTRGIAPSTRPRTGRYDSDALGRDIAALIGALGASQAIVIGHDFGAVAAYTAAALWPDRVGKLVTVGLPHPATLRPTLGKLWSGRHLLSHRLPGAAARMARHDFARIRTLYERWSPAFAWADGDFEAAKNAYAAPGCLEAALGYYRDWHPFVFGAGLQAPIAVPTLIVGGTSDGSLDAADFEASRRRFTGLVDVAMTPGGHFLHREHPDALLDHVVPFALDGVAGW